jgi:hypothetical protein
MAVSQQPFTNQMETLKRYWSNAQQTVKIEHVHVHEGGKAIVGNVETGGGASKFKDQSLHKLPMHQSPRCRAHSRRSGKPCQNAAMKNGRCRMHGGKATGAPKGNRNAWKHVHYPTNEVTRRLFLRRLLAAATH